MVTTVRHFSDTSCFPLLNSGVCVDVQIDRNFLEGVLTLYPLHKTEECRDVCWENTGLFPVRVLSAFHERNSVFIYQQIGHSLDEISHLLCFSHFSKRLNSSVRNSLSTG